MLRSRKGCVVRRHLLPLALALVLPLAGAALADTGLPGGATSLQETYDSWTVSCRMADAGGGKTVKQCALSQTQVDKSSGKHLLEVDVAPGATGATITLVLPFGLDLAQGVALQLDGGAVSAPVAFRTCLPVGCIARAALDDKTLAVYRTGTTLKLKAKAEGGNAIDFTVGMKGFSAAFDRVAALLK